MKKICIALLFVLFSFGIPQVNALESGELGEYSFSESNSKTNYAKFEFSNGSIILVEFDSSSDASLVRKVKEQINDNYLDGSNINNYGTGFLFTYQNADNIQEVSKKKYQVPKPGDVALFVETSDSSSVNISSLYFFYENGATEFPIIGHIIAGLEESRSIPHGANINNVRFVKVNTIKTKNKASSKSIPNAGTNYCSGDFLKPFKFVGRIFSILKILIPLIIIILGSIDFFKAIIANKDDEIKKSARSLLFRVASGVIIFFLPTVINLIFSLIDGWNQYSTDYSNCSKCLVNPNKC